MKPKRKIVFILVTVIVSTLLLSTPAFALYGWPSTISSITFEYTSPYDEITADSLKIETVTGSAISIDKNENDVDNAEKDIADTEKPDEITSPTEDLINDEKNIENSDNSPTDNGTIVNDSDTPSTTSNETEKAINDNEENTSVILKD